MIVTKSQSLDLIDALGEVKKHNYKDKSIGELLDKFLSKEQIDFVTEEFKKNPEDITGSEFEQKVEAIISDLNSKERITISLSFEPTLSLLERIYSKIKDSVKHDFLFDVIVDKTIIGGLVVGYKGKIFKKTIRDDWN